MHSAKMYTQTEGDDSLPARLVSIILAGGKSSRMQMDGRAKVCLPVAGTPVIIRQLQAFRTAGVGSHVVVVGYQAEEVMRTVSTHFDGEVWFAFQPQNLGTGNAAKAGARLLQKMQFSGRILVVPGDGVIAPALVFRLLEAAHTSDADLVFTIADKQMAPTAGRVIFSENGRPIASIEKFDSAKCRLLDFYFEHVEQHGALAAKTALAKARDLIGSDDKIALALGPLFEDLKGGAPLTRGKLHAAFSPEQRFFKVGPKLRLSGEQIEKSAFVNVSVYLFKAAPFFEMLAKLTANTAQKEEYLTDAVAILAADPRYRIVAEKQRSKNEVLAFNTPEELQAVESLYEMS